MRSVCSHLSKILQHHRIITGSHTYDACDPFVIITPRFHNIIASSPDRTHTHIRRMRSVCNHHSNILQHHRINPIAHTHTSTQAHTHDACDPFVVVSPRFYSIIASSPDRTRTRTPMWETTFARNSHARFGKPFYEPNILLSMVYGRKVLTKSGVGISRKCCFPHGRTLTCDACDPFVIITPRLYNTIASSPDRTVQCGEQEIAQFQAPLKERV